jgi:SAM-dependent MidA family methyltransferase
MDFITLISKTVVSLAQAKRELNSAIEQMIVEYQKNKIKEQQKARIELIKRIKKLEKNKKKDSQRVIKLINELLDRDNISAAHVVIVDNIIETLENRLI